MLLSELARADQMTSFSLTQLVWMNDWWWPRSFSPDVEFNLTHTTSCPQFLKSVIDVDWQNTENTLSLPHFDVRGALQSYTPNPSFLSSHHEWFSEFALNVLSDQDADSHFLALSSLRRRFPCDLPFADACSLNLQRAVQLKLSKQLTETTDLDDT